MNDVNTNRRLSPKQAIIVFHDKLKLNYYLEKRDIMNVEGKFILTAPVPLSDDIMKEVAKVYIETNAPDMAFGNLIPIHLLHGSNKPGKTIVVWYRPAMQRSLNFSSSLKIKGDATVQVPATLYAVFNTTLYVYALMTSDRPDLSTKLYNAPFFNIYSDGNVCLGTAPVGRFKAKTFEKEAERFERAFYMAEQNGGQHTDCCKTNLEPLWTQLIKKKVPFPSKQELIQHKKFKTLGDLISKLTGNNIDYE